MLKINGVDVATPKSFKVTIADIDGESNRNAAGLLIRDRIGTKRKLECEWPPLKNTEISTILKAVQNTFFSVTYPDPMEGNDQTKNFYVGDRTSPMYSCANGIVLWQGLSMDFIEQ